MAMPYREKADPRAARRVELEHELADIDTRIQTTPYLEVRKREIERELALVEGTPRTSTWMILGRVLFILLVLVVVAIALLHRLGPKVHRAGFPSDDPNSPGYYDFKDKA